MILLEACCVALLLSARGHPLRRIVRLPLLLVLGMCTLLAAGLVGEDVRPAELCILIGCAVIPTIELTLRRTQASPRGWSRWLVVAGPGLAMSVLLIRAFVLPASACAAHLIEHGEVHRRWALEYRALGELERLRAQRTGLSCFEYEIPDLPPRSAISISQATGPDGGWAYTATPKDCPRCRSFLLDSNGHMRSARWRVAVEEDLPVHGDEIVRLRQVLRDGCYVLGDVLCR